MAMDMKLVAKFLYYFSTPIVVFSLPLLLLPMVLVPGTDHTSEVDCFYVILLMGVFWCTEIIPLGVTALMPIFMFPLLGIMDVESVCKNYMEDTTMLLLGGIMIAIGVEKSGFHKRVAINALRVIGTSHRWVILGIMVPTWMLSMWISNTACAAMMMPMIQQIAERLEKIAALDQDNPDQKEQSYGSMGKTNLLTSSGNHDDSTQNRRVNKSIEKLNRGLVLSCSYAAIAGGSGTLIGSTPQLILQGITEDIWGKHGMSGPIGFTDWFIVGFPVAWINLLIVWLWMEYLFVGLDQLLKPLDDETTREEDQQIREAIMEEHTKLGPMKTDEKLVVILFIVLVIMWIFRDPGFDPAWAELFKEGYVSDSVPPILMTFIFFTVPATYAWRSRDPKADLLLTWYYVKMLFPWDIVLLLGGSFALADGMEKSGLSYWMSDQLRELKDLPDAFVLLIVVVFSVFFTEICSNSAAASILLPIAATMSLSMGKNPLYLMLGVTLGVQYAFMLPISSPCNAIAHATGKVNTFQMSKTGFMLNWFCVAAVMFAVETWCTPYFDLDTIPWDTNSTSYGK